MSIVLLWGVLGVHPAVDAQPTPPIPRIGYLGPDPQVVAPQLAAFKDALRAIGYDDGRNLVIEYRSAGQRFDRLPELASELVAAKVDIIVAVAPPAARAAQRATRAIPIVMVAHDPVAMGFVESFQRPGGNITGIAFQNPELTTKRLDYLAQAVPGLSRIAVIWNKEGSPDNALRALEAAARSRNIQVLALELREPGEFPAAIVRAKGWGAQGVVQLASPILHANRTLVIELLNANRLPASCELPEWAADGCLMTYSASMNAIFRRFAYFVDRILKGVKPADLPVEQPREFEFVINDKTAKAMGLVLPPELLLQATEVIR
jgi:putative ABC transport system substrate-binding protein